MKQFFLWPDTEAISLVDVMPGGVDCSVLESYVSSLYPGVYPVLFSSARAGLTTLLEYIGLGRADCLWVPKFSSHCLLEAVSMVTTPTIGGVDSGGVTKGIIYHQWGNFFENKFGNNIAVIEDSVDSLFIPGSSILTNDCDYAIWSLPKVLGAVAGGIVFCKNFNDSELMRKKRDERGLLILHQFMRFYTRKSEFVSAYWNGVESQQGKLARVYQRQIFRQLQKLNSIVDDRINLLKIISKDLANQMEAKGRLPSNLPIKIEEEIPSDWRKDGAVASGVRNFNVMRECPRGIWERCLPLPVHQSITPQFLKYLMLNIRRSNVKHAISFL